MCYVQAPVIMDIFAEEHVMPATSYANAQLILSCPVYPLAYQPMNCFKRFENRHFGHYIQWPSSVKIQAVQP